MLDSPLPHHTFFELLLFVGSERIVVRLVTILLPPSPFIIVKGKCAKFLPIYQNFFRIFPSVWAVTPILVLVSLPMQAKTRLHSISGIASTACGRPQALFLQIFHN